MSSSPSDAAAAAAKKKKQSANTKKEREGAEAERKPGPVARMYSLFELDPDLEDPQLLDAIRAKNKDALTYVLDPSRGHSKTSKSSTTETVWYLTSGSHHVTGNLDLLTDLTPVSDRWVKSMIGSPLQVLARGSVNSNGIILHDVWYVPDCDVNLVSGCQLGLKWYLGSGDCSLIRSDDEAVVGKAHMGGVGLLEVDFINTNSGAVWYIISNVSQHMTGNLEILTDFSPIRPSHTVQTHTGVKQQMCGKGSVKARQFSIPNISYVPGLTENVISLSQLTDSGFTVIFGANGFTVKKRRDGTEVGRGSYGGNQLFRLDSLKIPVKQ